MNSKLGKVLLLIGAVYGSQAFAYHSGDVVKLVVEKDCTYCVEAEAALDSHHIQYTTEEATSGAVPRLYVNGSYIGTGSDVVDNYANQK